MALITGLETGSKTTTKAKPSYLQQLEEEKKKKLAAQQAAIKATQLANANKQNRWGAEDAQSIINQTAAQKAATASKFNWNGLAPVGYFDQILNMKQSQAAANAKYSPQPNYLSMYTDWQSQGAVPNLMQSPYPSRDSHPPFPYDPTKPNSVLGGYVYGDTGGREPYDTAYPIGQMNTKPDRDILPDNWNPWTPPSTLPANGGGGGGGGGGQDQYQYPVYGDYGGGYGGSANSGINQWYANMVQWNINRPKGG